MKKIRTAVFIVTSIDTAFHQAKKATHTPHRVIGLWNTIRGREWSVEVERSYCAQTGHEPYLIALVVGNGVSASAQKNIHDRLQASLRTLQPGPRSRDDLYIYEADHLDIVVEMVRNAHNTIYGLRVAKRIY